MQSPLLHASCQPHSTVRGSLGAKKSYSGPGDLLKAIQRTVVVRESDAEASCSLTSEFVLYDPDEHRLQWQAQQLAAGKDSQAGSHAAQQSTADAALQLETVLIQDTPSLPTVSAPAGGSTANALSGDKMAWNRRTKVYADFFLVQKLRPHQQEGVK